MNSDKLEDPFQKAFREARRPPKNPRQPRELSLDEIGRINRAAQLFGLGNGILVGASSGYLARKYFRMSLNASAFIGLASGSVLAYFGSQKLVTQGMADWAREARAEMSEHEDNATELDLKAGQEMDFNAGVGGMHEFVDDSATTRGDH